MIIVHQDNVAAFGGGHTQYGSLAIIGAGRIAAAVAAVSITYTSYCGPFVYMSSEWAAGTTFHHKVYMRADNGTVAARVFNETDSAAVTGSELTTGSSLFGYQVTSALPLTNGKTYRIQWGIEPGGTGEFLNHGLIARQA